MHKIIVKSNKTCEKKIFYATEDIALLALTAKIIPKLKQYNAEAYKCKYCNGWHITSNTVK